MKRAPKKKKQISSGKLKQKNILIFAAVVVLVGIAGVVTLRLSSAITTPSIKVCNKLQSDDNIRATDGRGNGITIGRDVCKWIDDSGGRATVDVDPAGGYSDIDSWKKIGSGTSASWSTATCVVNETNASNPYSGYGAYTYYWTSKTNYCY
jgi:hypothetical protein